MDTQKLIDWVRVPFTFGHVAEVVDSRSNSTEQPSEGKRVVNVRYNGFVASLQLFVVLIAVTFALTVSSSNVVDFKYSGLDTLALIIYMFAGLVIMISLLIRKDVTVSEPAESTGSSESGRDSMGLVGLCAFFVLGSLRDVFQITAALDCALVWSGCERLYFTFVVHVLFHATRIAFVGTETLFCVVFNKKTFRDRIAIRYGLMTLQAANVSLWFDALLQESVRLFDSPSQSSREIIDVDCVGNATNVTDNVIRCFHQNTTLYSVIEDVIDPTFLPFTIEFMLLAWEGVGHCFFHCAASQQFTDVASSQGHVNGDENIESSDTEDQNREDSYRQDLSTERGLSLRSDNAEHNSRRNYLSVSHAPSSFRIGPIHIERNTARAAESTSTQSLLAPEDALERSPLLPHREPAITLNRRHSRVNLCSHAWMLLVFANGLLLCVFTFLCQYLSPKAVDSVKSVALYFLLFNWILMTFAVFIGYACSGNFQVEGRRRPFSSMSYLLLLSSFGPTAYNVFTCIAVLSPSQSQDPSSRSSELYVALEVLNTIHIYFQLSFSFYAERVRPDPADQSNSPTVFRAIVLYLAVTNGFLWLSATVGGYEFSGSHGKSGQVLQMIYFGSRSWGIVYNVVVPLLLFFRFNSCILLTQIYLTLRKADTERRLSSNDARNGQQDHSN